MNDLKEKELSTSEKKRAMPLTEEFLSKKEMVDFIKKSVPHYTPLESGTETTGAYVGGHSTFTSSLSMTYTIENPDVRGDYITLEKEEMMRKLFCMRDIEKVYETWFPKFQGTLITGKEYRELPMHVIKEVFTPFLVDEFTSAIRRSYREYSDLAHRYLSSGEDGDPEYDGDEIYITWQYVARAIKKLSLDCEVIKYKIIQECGALVSSSSTTTIIDTFKQAVNEYINSLNIDQLHFDWAEIFYKLFYNDVVLEK